MINSEKNYKISILSSDGILVPTYISHAVLRREVLVAAAEEKTWRQGTTAAFDGGVQHCPTLSTCVIILLSRTQRSCLW